MVLHGYGRSSALQVDPIEKKPLNHFLPGSVVFSLGGVGCNLGRRFCQNWELSRSQPGSPSLGAGPEAVARAALAQGCPSVAFTYNEPAVSHEYVLDTAQACRALGLRTVAVTAGYQLPAPRAEFYAGMDAANIDLKGFSDGFYRRFCAARLAPVLDTLRYVRHETGTWLELTTLLIPGANDAPAELDRLTAWVAGELGPEVPLHSSAFHPAWRLADLPPTPAATLREARRIALGNGLHHVYLGNLPGPEGQATHCHRCGGLLVGRDRYRLTAFHLTPQGGCRHCGAICPGVFG